MYDFFAISTSGGSKDPAQRLEKRFINYLISFPFARQQRDQADGKPRTEEERRRELLQVEQINYDERARLKRARENFINRVSRELHEEVYHRMLKALEDPQYVRERLVPMPKMLPELLDTLSTKAASMAIVEQLVSNMPWFHDSVLRVVNNPPFSTKRKDTQIKLESLRVAMSFVGVENLRLLTPAFVMQNWLPPSTEPFTLFRRKVWDHSLATAVVAHEIAQHKGLRDPGIAYTIGMFHELGKIALTKLYLKVFDEVQREWSIKTVNDKAQDKHNAIVQLTADEQFLRDLMLEQDKRASHIVVEGWQLKRVPLSPHLVSFTQASNLEDYSDYALALAQANAYSEYRMLKDVDMVTAEEAKHLLNKYKLPAELLSQLLNLNLKRPKIVVPE